MSEITFNIYGGTQQINPSATTAEQHFYGDQFAREMLNEEAMDRLDLSPEARQFALYLNMVQEMPRYLSMLSSCESAADIAKVVMNLLDSEDRITREEVVKKRFIERILPLAPKVASSARGNSIDNIRVQINDALMQRPHRHQ